MNIQKAKEIPGWMDEPELIWLAQCADVSKMIAEVGCWMGRSTRALADNTSGRVYAVDTWRGSEEHQGDFVGKHPDWVLNTFKDNMKDHIKDRKVVVLHMKSTQAAHWMFHGNYKFNLVFIDGAHDYDNISADIKAWKPLMESGGIISGHDYGHPPIRQAVNELLDSPESSGSIWYKQL